MEPISFDQNGPSHEFKIESINLLKLKPDTRIAVKTKNSVYHFRKLDFGNEVEFKGGRHFPEFIKGHLVGSTFGGTMIIPNVIGRHMRLEVHTKHGVLTTSPVMKAVLAGAGWHYKMDW